jgi:hypothetical protein
VALEAMRDFVTITEGAHKTSVSPILVRQWKKAFVKNTGSVFDNRHGPKRADHNKVDARYVEIGSLRWQPIGFKKSGF